MNRLFSIPLAWVCFFTAFAGKANAQMHKIAAELTPIVETQAIHPNTKVKAAVKVKLPETYHMQSNKPSKPLLVPTTLLMETPKGVTVEEIVYPKSISLKQEGVDELLSVFEREYTIGVVFNVTADVAPGEITIPTKLKYQPCDEGMCYPPNSSTNDWKIKVVDAATPLTPQETECFSKIAFGTGQAPSSSTPTPEPTPTAPTTESTTNLDALDSFEIVSSKGGYLNADQFIEFIHNAEGGVQEKGAFEGKGPIAIILLVLLGGFALNLTPCVLPMIPINLAIIGAGAQAGSSRRGLMLGAVYGSAMAIVYGVLGLVVILTAGTFGTLNSSPWFNLAITALFLVLGLAMFDVFTIDLSRWSGKFNSNAKSGSFVLAFSMGSVAALLAGACVAPVVIQVILFSSNLYNSGTKIALALPFVLGVGMALPWPIAGAGMSALPKPGMWMKRVKQGFGVLIVGSACYYGFLTYETFASRSTDTATPQQASEHSEPGWYSNLNEGLAAAQNEKKPVIVDLWASWCKNCLTMDQTTFKNEKVKQAMNGYIKIKLQADHPDEEPIKSIIHRFKAIGLPNYVILKPKVP